MKFICLVLFVAVFVVFGEKLVEESHQNVFRYDSSEEQNMHTKCGSLVAEHQGLQNEFTADKSTEGLTSRRSLRQRQEQDKFADLDLPFSLPFSLPANAEGHLFPPGFSLSLPFADGAEAHHHGGQHFSTHMSSMSTISAPLAGDIGLNAAIGINPIDPDCDCNLPPALNATCCHIPKPICNPGKIDCKIPWYVPFPPVCGCDGKTYDNFCDALFGGCVKCWKQGSCPK